MRPLPADEAVALLQPMSVAERIQAIWNDVNSGEQRFAKVDTFDLAYMLDVPQPEKPAGWLFVTGVEIRSLEDYHRAGRIARGEGLASMLEDRVDAARYEQVRAECEEFDAGGRSDFSFLLPGERDGLAKEFARRELQSNLDNGLGCVACYCAQSAGRELWFHAVIEDDGSCLYLTGPYDGVDGPLRSEDGPDFVCVSF